ncbi:MAG: PadR family transcriptional regulator [Caldilineaceae bacterium]
MRNRTMRPEKAGRDQGGPRSRHSSDSNGDDINGDATDAHKTEDTQERKRHGRGHHGRGHHEGEPGRRGGRRGGGRGRARRGEARYILLDALRDGPKHGYEIIKSLEERSAGQYVPSPGTVYPTLQYLEDQGLIRAEQDAERRVYQLTEAGNTELVEQTVAIADFWAHFGAQAAPTAGQPEVGFLEEELAHLNRIVWSGLQPAIAQNEQATIRRVRETVEACQSQVRAVIADEAANR